MSEHLTRPQENRGRATKLGLLAASLLVAFAVAEVGLRAVPGLMGLPNVDWPVMTRHDSLLGWSLKPEAVATVRTPEFVATEWTSAEGLRGAGIPAPRPPGETRVLLLGDSFGEGYTVDQDETVAATLERELDAPSLRVINASTRGWSTDQELLWFMSHADEIQPDVTVLLFYHNDVCYNVRDRYWRGRKPHFVLEDDSLALAGVPVPPPPPPEPPSEAELGLRELLEGSALYGLARQGLARARPTPLRVTPERAPWALSPDAHPCLEPGWDMTERLIVRLREEVTGRGGRFLVFWVPSKWAVYDEDWDRLSSAFDADPADWDPAADADRLRSVCERNGIECVISREAYRAAARASDERLYFEIDAHWTPAGHALAAHLLAERLREDFGPRGSRDALRWP